MNQTTDLGQQFGFALLAWQSPEEGRVYQWWRGASLIRASAAGIRFAGCPFEMTAREDALNVVNAVGEAVMAHEWLKARSGNPGPEECLFRADVTRLEGTA